MFSSRRIFEWLLFINKLYSIFWISWIFFCYFFKQFSFNKIIPIYKISIRFNLFLNYHLEKPIRKRRSIFIQKILVELIGESEVKEGSFRPIKGVRQWIKDAAGMRLAERAAFSREYGCTSSAINLPDDLPRLMSTGVFRAQNPPIVPQLVRRENGTFRVVSLRRLVTQLKKSFSAERTDSRIVLEAFAVLFTFCWSRSTRLLNGPVDSSLPSPRVN